MRVGLLFPGQGSQYAGMAEPWLEHPEGRKALEQASDVFGWDVVEATRDAEALERTDVVQPAVVACDLAAFAVLQAEGVAFGAAAGHSLGEYAALVAAGAVSLEAGLSILAVRARAMAEASEANPGGMTALIGVPPDEARDICEIAGRGDVLTVGNENGPKQTVLSGTIPALEKAEELARSRGAKAVRLPVAGAFHSPLMLEAVQPVREAISRVEFRSPDFPVVPNASGKPTTQPLILRDLLSRHLVSPVLWGQSMQAMAEMGIGRYVEAGPGDVLAKLSRRILPEGTVATAGSPDEARAAADELAAEPGEMDPAAPARDTGEAR